MASTIRQLLHWASAELTQLSDSPRLDSEILLAHCLERNRAYLMTWPERVPDDDQIERFKDLIRQRLQPQPIAYLTGYREFYSLQLKTTADTLVPRPETEMLVDHALHLISDKPAAEVLDMGTGTGAIALAIKQLAPGCRMTATDLSPGALEVAQQNADTLGLEIEFMVSDWYAALAADRRFDVIVSNPPYIAAQDPYLEQGDLPAEPRQALVSGEDGLAALRVIVPGAKNYLRPGGWLVVEHGYDQEAAMTELLRVNHYLEVGTMRDFNDLPRMSVGRIGR